MESPYLHRLESGTQKRLCPCTYRGSQRHCRKCQ
nr:MAG TPA: hypothetical protein [Caudoviricetes sp.]